MWLFFYSSLLTVSITSGKLELIATQLHSEGRYIRCIMHRSQVIVSIFPISLLALLLFLSGCSRKPTYQLKPLEPQKTYDQVTKKTETGEVMVRCNTCSRQYIREILGKQGDALMGLRSHKRIIPVQIYIENNSDYAWMLSPYDVHLPLTDMELVTSRFIKAATKKGLASLSAHTTFGLLGISLGTAASIFHPALGASLFGAGCSMLITAPVFSHNKAAAIGEQNAHYKHVLDTITLTKDTIIHPHDRLSKLIFVEQRKATDQFGLRLCNAHNVDHTMLYQLYLNTYGR
jgi:hypothetical protein